MNVKLAVALAVACLFLLEVCFAMDNNLCDNSRLFDRDDKGYKNKRVVTTFGRRGAKLRVHSLYNPLKWIQIAHVSVTEVDKHGDPVYLTNAKGKTTKNLRGINLQNTDFDWSTPTVVAGPQGRTVDVFFKTAFQVLGSAGVTTQVTFHVNVIQQNSTQVVNGVNIRREEDDVQFSLDIVNWPFANTKNQLDWQFYVKTNYAPTNARLDGTLVGARNVRGMYGQGVYIFKDGIISYPDQVQVDGIMEPCSHELSNVGTRGDYTLDVVMPSANHHLFYNAIVKVINLPSGGDPNPCGFVGATGDCPPGCQLTNPPSCGTPDPGTGNGGDPCTPNPCQNQGTCASSNNAPVCTCVGSWSGPTCANSACFNNPCQNQGTCTATSTGAASCACTATWSGPTCSTPNPCGSNPCQNGAPCLNSGSTAQCQCPGGYSGPTCGTFDPCYNVNCNGGSCSLGQCSTCPSGFTGSNCQTNMCSPNPCVNGGSCSGGGSRAFTCACLPGFSGATCQIDACAGVTCPGGVTCSGGVCPDPCAGNPCSNGGTCVVGASSTSCNCPPNFNGPTCGNNMCANVACGLHGVCSAGSCVCSDGYSGNNCQTPPNCDPSINPCNPNPCANNGVCSCNPADNSASCACAGGWTGPTCTANPCQTFICQNGGTCAFSATAFGCTCANGWTGANCQTNVCAAFGACQNGGSCVVDVNNAASCTCAPGFGGDHCQSQPCVPNPCQNGGGCVANGGVATCQCTETFSGPVCADVNPNMIWGTPVDTAVQLDYSFRDGSPDGARFGMYTAGNTIVVFFPQSGSMRLYDTTGQGINLADTAAVSAFMDVADFVQLSVGNLVELDETLTPIAWNTVDLTGGTWAYDDTNIDPQTQQFVYLITSGPVPVTFQMLVKYYADAAKAKLNFDPNGSEEVAIGAGALKFSVSISPWPFTDGGLGNNFLQWQIYLTTRYNGQSDAAIQQAAGTVGYQRFHMSSGDYTPLESKLTLDGNSQAFTAVITSNFDVNTAVNYVNHIFPEYFSQLSFDPILAVSNPNDPPYPPWVSPATPGGASVIRDPRSQFQGAATLHSSIIAVALATVAAFAAARL